MLARRFTMVCLIAAIFGMGLSILVAQSSPPAHSEMRQAGDACGLGLGFGCQAGPHRTSWPVR
ncbi:MAG: hypothetical protein ACK4F5_04785 [Aliihoeflea sp.]